MENVVFDIVMMLFVFVPAIVVFGLFIWLVIAVIRWLNRH